jgi:hypothetical protein
MRPKPARLLRLASPALARSSIGRAANPGPLAVQEFGGGAAHNARRVYEFDIAAANIIYVIYRCLHDDGRPVHDHRRQLDDDHPGEEVRLLR